MANECRHGRWRRTLLLLGLMTLALAPSARMADDIDDDDDSGPPEICDPVVDVGGSIYLNGLPLVQRDLEIVGNTVKVTVQKRNCRVVSLSGLPFQWRVTGPTGPAALTAENTLRPHFRPPLGGSYQARLTYAPREPATTSGSRAACASTFHPSRSTSASRW